MGACTNKDLCKLRPDIPQNDSLFYKLGVQILYFSTFIIFLYLFRALLWSSSGGQMYYYSIWYRHSL